MTPMILFVSIVRISSSTCQTVLDAGFLDLLRSIRVNLIRPFSILEESTGQQNLRITCNTVFLDITAYPEYHQIVLNHPLSASWPQPFVFTHPIKFLLFGDFLLSIDDDVHPGDLQFLTLSL